MKLIGHKGKNSLDAGLFDIWKNHWFCGGKREYNSKDEINREIYRIMNESFSNTTNLRGYKCKFCHKYHLTSKNG